VSKIQITSEINTGITSDNHILGWSSEEKARPKAILRILMGVLFLNEEIFYTLCRHPQGGKASKTQPTLAEGQTQPLPPRAEK